MQGDPLKCLQPHLPPAPEVANAMGKECAAFGQGGGRRRSESRGAAREEGAQSSAQRCSHLQEGAIPEATPNMQHSRAVKAVERAAEHHAVGRAPGAVLGTRTRRALSHMAPWPLRYPRPRQTWSLSLPWAFFHPSMSPFFSWLLTQYLSHFSFLGFQETPLLQEVFPDHSYGPKEQPTSNLGYLTWGAGRGSLDSNRQSSFPSRCLCYLMTVPFTEHLLCTSGSAYSFNLIHLNSQLSCKGHLIIIPIFQTRKLKFKEARYPASGKKWSRYLAQSGQSCTPL